MRDIGVNIRRARTRRHLTQDDLAQTVHTTRQTISNYETGRSRPDVETLQRLADALGVELTELLDGEPSADARRAALRRLCIMGAVTLVLALPEKRLPRSCRNSTDSSLSTYSAISSP